ncbi:hypothetical protein ACFY1S_19890 [Micromonospora sp. NPDC000663]
MSGVRRDDGRTVGHTLGGTATVEGLSARRGVPVPGDSVPPRGAAVSA